MLLKFTISELLLGFWNFQLPGFVSKTKLILLEFSTVSLCFWDSPEVVVVVVMRMIFLQPFTTI